MNRSVLLVVSVVLVAAIAFLGCQLPEPQFGALILTVGSRDIVTKTLVPDVTMVIATYDISANGPNGASFEGTGITDTTYVKNNLVVGAWTVTVNGRNPEGIVIATATEAFGINHGQTTIVPVTVVPLEGEGILEIEISWPAGVVADPSIVATLTPAGGSASTIGFPVTGDGASYDDGEIEAGYYDLVVQLLDGTTEVWGMATALRILAGETTSGSVELTLDDINPLLVGHVQITIGHNLKNPLEVTLSGAQSSLLVGTDMTVTAATSQAVDSYQWYLNGAFLVGEQAASITIGASLRQGPHRLDLIVHTGVISSSATGKFFVAAGPGIAQWLPTSSFDTARSFMGTAASGGHLYIVAGQFEGQENVLSDVQFAAIQADGSVGDWSATTPLPVAMTKASTLAHNGHLYVVGGWYYSGGHVFLDTVQYAQIGSDGTLGAWGTTTPIPRNKRHTGVVVYDGHMYVLGGQYASLLWTDEVHYAPVNADGTLGSWTATTSLPHSIGIADRAVAHNGYIYAAYVPYNSAVGHLVFAPINPDGSLGSWSSLSLPADRLDGQLQVANGYLYCLGPRIAEESYTSEVYYAQILSDGTLGSWSSTASYATGRYGHGSETYGAHVYVVGGWIGMHGQPSFSDLNDVQYARFGN